MADREAASQVVEQAFGARSARNWAAQCDVLTSTLREQLERAAPKAPHGQACDRRLAALAQKAAPAALEDSMTEPLAALRVNGPQAFAFFHGKGGRDYVIPMQKEHGEWKVAALSAQEAP